MCSISAAFDWDFPYQLLEDPELRQQLLSSDLGYSIPGKPVAHNNELLSFNYGLLYGILAHYFGLLGVPAKLFCSNPASARSTAWQLTRLQSLEPPPGTPSSPK